MTRSAHDEAVEAACRDHWGDEWDEIDEKTKAAARGIIVADITAYLRHMRAAGFVVVPVEPTVAMLQDGDMAIRRARPGGVSGMTIEAQTKAECARAGACWAAMLLANAVEVPE